ncbi:MAG: HD-GYP domain-containing protein [Planctomycetota bacterium]
MPSSFGNRTSGRPPKASGGFFHSLRLHGALLAALIAGEAVFGTGLFLEFREENAQVGGLASRVQSVAAGLEALLRKGVEDGSWGGLQTGVARLLGSEGGLSARMTGPDGLPLAQGGRDAAAPRDVLEGLMPVAPGILTGRLGSGRVVQFYQEVPGELAPLGSILVRARLSPPVGAGDRPCRAGGAAGLVFLLYGLFLAYSLRSAKAVVKTLRKVTREEFWHRAPISGCSEIGTIAAATNEALDSLEKASVRVQEAYIETALALTRTVEAKDRYTSGHSQRVARLGVEMGEWLGFDRDRLEMLHIGGMLHDIGKVAVPDSVLLKKGPLDDEEYEEMKRHPMAGDRILGIIPGLRDMADMARSHHERWDGKGYPLGVSGDAIPLEGRILAVADAYDAMVTKRSYKPAMPIEEALRRIEKDAGTHFDPEIARLFVSMKRNGKGYRALHPERGEGEGPPAGSERSVPVVDPAARA